MVLFLTFLQKIKEEARKSMFNHTRDICYLKKSFVIKAGGRL